MTPRLDRIAAPAAKPISLTEAKAHCRVDTDDDDTHIQTLIDAAIAHVDATGVLGRGMVNQTWGQWVGVPSGPVALRLGGVSSLDAVRYHDAAGVLQTATLADFHLLRDGEATLVTPVSGAAWPALQARPDALRLDFVTGYGAASSDVPASVRVALLLLVGHWYENRESVAIGATVAEVPMAFRALIEAERVGWYG